VAVTSIGVCDVGCHAAFDVARSQRRVPTTIAPGPPRVSYERLCGATTVNRVVCAFVGDDASVSSKTIVRDARYARVIRRRIAVASGAVAGRSKVSVRPPIDTRSGPAAGDGAR
jgi:hypothetical protein